MNAIAGELQKGFLYLPFVEDDGSIKESYISIANIGQMKKRLIDKVKSVFLYGDQCLMSTTPLNEIMKMILDQDQEFTEVRFQIKVDKINNKPYA